MILRPGLLAGAALLAIGMPLGLGVSAAQGVPGQTTPAASSEPDVDLDSTRSADQLSLTMLAKLPIAGGLSKPLELQDEVTVTATPTTGGATVDLKATATRPGETAGSRAAVMLVLDTSDSMRKPISGGTRFKAELAAAGQAVDLLGKSLGQVDIGLLTFASTVDPKTPPIANHARVKNLITRLEPAGDTALYEAIVKAADQLPTTGRRAIVMVTDGKNDPFGKNPPKPVSRAKRLQQQQYQAKAKALLNQKANRIQFTGVLIGRQGNDLSRVAPKGTVQQYASESDLVTKLNSVFATGADKLKNQLQITAPIPVELRNSPLRFTIRATTTSNQPILRSLTLGPPSAATTPATAAAPPLATPSMGARLGTPAVIGGLGALFLAMCVLIVSATSAVTAGESKESEVSRRLSFYTLGGNRGKPVAVTPEAPRLSDSRLARSAVNLINRIARQRKLDQALDARLEKAGLPIRTAEWTLLHLGIAVGSALLLLVAARGMLLGAILGLALGLGLPWLFLSARTSLRERRFLAQLPDTLQLLSGSLAAGYSLPQAMDAVLRESQAPISVEFNRALIETRLGMPPEDAMEGIATRTASKDFSWVVMAIRIQREVGGNLAELLSSVADTLRERERLRRQVSALSAEGRLSGIILGALPLVFALFLIFTKPEYISPLFDDPRGLILLAGGALLLLAGGFWMSRLVKVEV